MNEKLAQARAGWQHAIDENPDTVDIERRAMVSDGFGGTVANPFGTVTTHQVELRIAHEEKAADGPGPGGIAEDYGRFVMANWKQDIQRDDEFEAIGYRWRVGIVDAVKKFGGVVGYRAPIIEATESVTST